jgi:hypothetical protein
MSSLLGGYASLLCGYAELFYAYFFHVSAERFFSKELQKVDVRDVDIWKIEKIIQTKATGNNKYYFIKWLYWPKKFNSWISARNGMPLQYIANLDHLYI